MHYKELCGKPYLSAEDLPENKDVPVVIESAHKEDAFNPRTKKPAPVGVLKFKNKDLKMIMNVTNSKTIMQAYGPETKNWIGKEVILYRTETRLAGKMVPCLRIKVR
ncbi:MAG: hypothetical protein HRU26_04005 [Psychroserpens sp.]|nr:hypothetical protein [Psychroserpens sp.]